jgi:hypothetical protein
MPRSHPPTPPAHVLPLTPPEDLLDWYENLRRPRHDLLLTDLRLFAVCVLASVAFLLGVDFLFDCL